MKNEYLITNSQNDTFLLYTKPNLGLLLRKNNPKTIRDEVLFERCSKNIDVCMNKKDEIYIICQNEKGYIVGIFYKDNNWHKFDILVPKFENYYDKIFCMECYNENIFCFYNMILEGKNMLFAHNIKEKNTKAISILEQNNPIFDCCKISKTQQAMVYTDEDSTLGLKIFDVEQNKSLWYMPIIKSSNIKNLKVCFVNSKLHIIFNKNDILFYICIDMITRVQIAMFDIGTINSADEIFLSPSKKDIKIFIINKEEIQINIFDLNARSSEIKYFNPIKEEIINLKLINNDITTTYPSVVINRQHISLYNFLNKIEDKDENLEQKLMELTKQIEDIKNKMR